MDGGWTRASMARLDWCGDGCKLLRLDCCGDDRKLSRLHWCGYGCKPSAAGLVRQGLQTSAELLRIYKFNQKIVVYKGIANNKTKKKFSITFPISPGRQTWAAGPERWWLQTISSWTDAAKATNLGGLLDRCGDGCYLQRQDWCDEGGKLELLDRSGDGCKPSAAGLVRRRRQILGR